MKATISLLLLGVSLTRSLSTCQDVWPPNCHTADVECEEFFEGCIDIEFPGNLSTTMSSGDCDDDLDAHNWRLDYIGKSTQFRLYDPCDNDWIKFKMEDLTEYDGATGKKTGNKETSFASADWEWGTGGGYTTYNGYNAIVNKFNASELTKMDASLVFTTLFFREDAMIGNQSVSRNALKFALEIGGWDYIDDGNYIEMCFDILTKNSNDGVSENDDGSIDMNGFAITNEEQASCEGASDMDVTVRYEGNQKNHLTLCYVFTETCSSGNIYYDPIVRSKGTGSGSDNDTDSETNGAFAKSFAFTTFLVLFSVFSF